MGRAEDLFEKIKNEGEEAIEFFIETRTSEELFLDFKRSADNGTGRKLHQNDRQNLAKAISGFGNSEGGVVVWGIECSQNAQMGDVACSKVPIENPKRFVSWLEGVVSGCTVPPHPQVQNVAVEMKDNASLGFVATLIPKSYEAPHQCIKPIQYYIRVGSEFAPAPHSILTGLMGRTPTPFLFHNWNVYPAEIVTRVEGNRCIRFTIGFQLVNGGPTIAKELYVNLKLVPPKGPSTASVGFPTSDNWTGYHVHGVIYNIVSKPSFSLTPDAVIIPLDIDFILREPFESNLYYKFVFGSAETKPKSLSVKVTPDEILSAIKTFIESPFTAEAKRQVVIDALKLEEKHQKEIYLKQYYDSL